MAIDKDAHIPRCRERAKCINCKKSMRALNINKIVNFTHHVMNCSGEGLLRCQSCQLVMPNKLDLDKHKRVCNLVERTCHACKRLFPNGLALEAHINERHPVIRCAICNQIFMTYQELRHHTTAAHLALDAENVQE